MDGFSPALSREEKPGDVSSMEGRQEMISLSNLTSAGAKAIGSEKKGKDAKVETFLFGGVR